MAVSVTRMILMIDNKGTSDKNTISSLLCQNVVKQLLGVPDVVNSVLP